MMPPGLRVSKRQLTTAQGTDVFDVWFKGKIIASRISPISADEAADILATHIAAERMKATAAASKSKEIDQAKKHQWRDNTKFFED